MKKYFFPIFTAFAFLLFSSCHKEVSIAEITLNQTVVALFLGESMKLVATIEPTNATESVIWSSSNKSVATVSDDGTVNSVAEGKAVISVFTRHVDQEGSRIASCTVNVCPEVMRMTTNKSGEVILHLYFPSDNIFGIDWGDGSIPATVETGELPTSLVSRIYSGTSPCTIRIASNILPIKMRCVNNQITSLDVSKNTELENLDCYRNQLTNLDVSNNAKLVDLNCGANQLMSLDVSRNTELNILNCSKNQFSSLDVSKNAGLTDLRCDENLLTSLDVSKNTKLQWLYCSLNQLSSLDVSTNTKLFALNCMANELSTDALDALFSSLNDRLDLYPWDNNRKYIFIGDNPGTAGCNRSIATEKGWIVQFRPGVE